MAERACALSTLGLILAGGRSTRMGIDKRFLPFGQQTFLEKTKCVADAAFGVSNVLISGNIENMLTVQDCVPDMGPVGGLYSVLCYLNEVKKRVDWICVLPVDMPRMNVEIINLLQSETLNASSETMAVSFDGFELPMMLRAYKELISDVECILKIENRSARSIFTLKNTLKVKKIECPADIKAYFTNVNTPSDYEDIINVS